MRSVVPLQVRGDQSEDFNDVSWRDQNEVGEEQTPKTLKQSL